MQRGDHQINLQATNIQSLNLAHISQAITEPPTTRGLTGSQLSAFREEPIQLNLPACSVAVERGVKDVTEAALKCTDSDQRDGIIFQKIEARKKNPYKNRNKVKAVIEE